MIKAQLSVTWEDTFLQFAYIHTSHIIAIVEMIQYVYVSNIIL